MRGKTRIQSSGKPCSQYIPDCSRFWELLPAVALVERHALRLDQVNSDPLHAVAEVKHPGSAIAQVHDPVAHIGAAVIDADDDPLAVLEVGHLDESPQRELPVRGRKLE